MNAPDWFDEYEWNARQAGDRERAMLGAIHRQAYSFRESDPDQALAMLGEGRALAVSLKEPWWSLYYDQQRVHALLHFKQDYREVLELAVRNTLEARKGTYAEFPRKLLIHGDLVGAYLGIDPLGYADAIQQALDYLEAQTPRDGDERYLLLGNQRQFALEQGRLDSAYLCCLRSLDVANRDADPARAKHFLVFTFAALAEIAWRQGDWLALEETVRTGSEMAREVGHQVELAGFWMWHAIVARHYGDERTAETLYQHATRRLARMGMQPDSVYREAECAYHEMAGRVELALAARETEWLGLRDRGRLAAECACLVARAGYLQRLGGVGETDLRLAREAAMRLRKPERALEAIARIESTKR